jgi:hypothetical protein
LELLSSVAARLQRCFLLHRHMLEFAPESYCASTGDTERPSADSQTLDKDIDDSVFVSLVFRAATGALPPAYRTYE